MTVSDVMTPLMDKARKLTGLTDKISIARLTRLMNHFELRVNPNIFTGTTTFVPNAKSVRTPFECVATNINLVNGWTYTFSADTKSSDNKEHLVRYRLYDFSVGDQSSFPKDDDGVLQTGGRISVTFTVPNNNYKHYQFVLYNSDKNTVPDWLVTFENCKLELGDLATPFQKVGGS